MTRSERVAALLLLTILGAGFGLWVLQPLAPRYSDRLTLRGNPHFLVGVNYPWKTGQDFGSGAWGYSGAAHPTTYLEIDADFANIAAQGIKVVKWRVFNDGRYSPEFDQRGYVTGLDEEFFHDLDAAIELVRKHDLYLVFTLFASGFWTTDCSNKGVELGGHADALADALKRRSLLQRAVIPTLKHLGRNDRVLAYEIIAEPEWGIRELMTDEGDRRIKVPLSAVRAFVRDTAAAVHYYTSALATVESNRASHMGNWRGLGLDYYSFSWYDWVEPWEPLDTLAATYSLDRPVVLGEFPVGNSQYYGLRDVLDIAYMDGYAGAFAWSFWGGDKYGKWSEHALDYIDWVQERWSVVNVDVDGTEPPSRDFQEKPPPYHSAFLGANVTEGKLTVDVDVRVPRLGFYTVKFYLQRVGGSPDDTIEEGKEVSFQRDGRRFLTVEFDNVPEDLPYKLSVAIFDPSGQLLKWFDGLGVLALQNGSVQTPELSQAASEDPCYVGE